MSLAIWGRERGYATLRYAPDSDQRSHNTLNALLHCLAKCAGEIAVLKN